MKNNEIIKFALSTEKSLRLMQTDNKLIFAVDKKAKKADIKKACEELFNVKVAKVNTYITTKGEKRAYIKFTPESLAIDVATNLGLM